MGKADITSRGMIDLSVLDSIEKSQENEIHLSMAPWG